MNDVNFANAFREEAAELLAELENALLELEESPADTELIGRVFRAMHTIKGSGAMFGFDDIAAFTHQVETIYDQVRTGKLTVNKKMIALTLAARDQIKAMLDSDGAGDTAVSAGIIKGFKELAGAEGPSASLATATVAPPPAAEPPPAGAQCTYRIRFRPHRHILANGTNPVALLNELRALGYCQIVAQMSDVPVLADYDPESCYPFWDVILSTDQGIDAIRDIFIFVEDDCELAIDLVDSSASGPDGETYKKLGEILVERGDIALPELCAVLDSQKRLGELLVAKGLVDPNQIKSALAEQQHVAEMQQARKQKAEAPVSDAAASIRVPAERLDTLVNLVGELVTIQARMTQTAASREDAELIAIAEEVERLTGELRDNALNIRMLPIGTTFKKFKRLVHDLSQELGKEIELITEGAETELDKTVIERLNDPMVHLIRNCIDHGIESPEARLTAGKPRQGKVVLSAVHSGDSVLLTIVDDGAGLDKNAILAKAQEKGLLGGNNELSDQEIFNLIFAPGFSTAKTVTSISGRGVGMDVVKRGIDALRGAIEVDSRPGEGTTISLCLPLTMAIIETLLVRIGKDRFLIPLALVSECIELTRAEVTAAHGREMATVRGHLVPYIPLRQRFAIGGAPPDIEQVVIVEIDGLRVGVVVDQVIGEHQTVIKSLGRVYKNVAGVSGATILGDGSVALILDVQQLVRSVGVGR